MNIANSSNDPEKKNLNLEIFSTDIVEYISIRYMAEVYMAILLEETLTYQRLQRKGFKLILALK
jgi:hypothetical protein